MEIGYTEEQQALRERAAGLLPEPAHPRGRGRSWPQRTASAPSSAGSSSRWAADGWLGIGWPKEWGGQGRSAIEQFIFFDESMRSGRAGADADHQHRRADHHELRHRRAEGVLPAQDPGRRDPLLHRLHRAQRRHRPGRAARPGPCATATSTSSTGPRSSPAWPATPTTSGWPPAPIPRRPSTRASPCSSSPWTRPGIRVVPMKLLGDHNINYTFYEDVRVPAADLVGGENNGWSLITNQLNHERVTLCSPGHHRAGPRRRPGLGPGDQAGRRPAGDRPGVGAGAPGPGPRQARVPPAHQLEGGLAGHPGPPRRGRRLDHQGVRHRVLPAGLPARCWRSSARPAT